MNKLLIILTFPLMLLIAHPVLSDSALVDVISQADDAEPGESVCPVLVRTAMDLTTAECDGTGRNQACYGHILLEAQLQGSTEAFDFDAPGNRVDVARLQSLRLSPLRADENIWGIALMRIQANLPASQLEDVTLLVFGDVEIDNAVGTPTMAEVSVVTTSFVNVRRGPTTNAGVIGTLRPDQTVTALERLADGSWLRVELEDGTTGWVLGELVSQPEEDALNVVDAWTPYYRPMQAFYFRSGGDDAACPQEQTDGMLIQTPEGVGEITLLINEIDIQIGSTVFFQARPGEAMTVTTLEGYARVSVNGVAQTAIAGTQVSVPLNDDLTPAGSPTPPRPYDENAVQSLPLNGVVRPVVPPPALTETEIEAFIAGESGQVPPGLSGDAPGLSGDAPGQSGDAPGRSEDGPPGQRNNPPGHGDNPPPGQGGTPPGQGGNPPGQAGNPPPGQGGTPPGQGGTPPGQGGNPPPGQGGESGGDWWDNLLCSPLLSFLCT